VTAVNLEESGGDRWVPALHNLYLITLLITFVATVTVHPIAPLWSAEVRNTVAGLAVAEATVRAMVTSLRDNHVDWVRPEEPAGGPSGQAYGLGLVTHP
jgi:hypothetical protein